MRHATAKIVVLLLTATAALADEDPWAKVRELKGGAELRIYKVGAKEPVAAKLYETTADSVIVIVGNEQKSIPKEVIDRLDAREVQQRKVMKRTRADRKIARPGAETTSATMPGATTSVTTGFELPSKPAFQKIYSRTPDPKKEN